MNANEFKQIKQTLRNTPYGKDYIETVKKHLLTAPKGQEIDVNAYFDNDVLQRAKLTTAIHYLFSSSEIEISINRNENFKFTMI